MPQFCPIIETSGKRTLNLIHHILPWAKNCARTDNLNVIHIIARGSRAVHIKLGVCTHDTKVIHPKRNIHCPIVLATLTFAESCDPLGPKFDHLDFSVD